jgi:hypothetical protein
MYNLSGLGWLREGGSDVKKLVATVAVVGALLAPTAANAGESGPIVRTEQCPPGYTGRIIYVGDRGLWWGCYRLP